MSLDESAKAFIVEKGYDPTFRRACSNGHPTVLRVLPPVRSWAESLKVGKSFTYLERAKVCISRPTRKTELTASHLTPHAKGTSNLRMRPVVLDAFLPVSGQIHNFGVCLRGR